MFVKEKNKGVEKIATNASGYVLKILLILFIFINVACYKINLRFIDINLLIRNVNIVEIRRFHTTKRCFITMQHDI